MNQVIWHIEPKAILVRITSDLELEDLDEKDFLDRTDVLSSLGMTVAVSRSSEYKPFIEYLSDLEDIG